MKRIGKDDPLLNETSIIYRAKSATISVFTENFSYQDVANNPNKETLDDFEVVIKSLTRFEDGWVVETSTIFDDGLVFAISSRGSDLVIDIYQKIHSVSLVETAESEERNNA